MMIHAPTWASGVNSVNARKHAVPEYKWEHENVFPKELTRYSVQRELCWIRESVRSRIVQAFHHGPNLENAQCPVEAENPYERDLAMVNGCYVEKMI